MKKFLNSKLNESIKDWAHSTKKSWKSFVENNFNKTFFKRVMLVLLLAIAVCMLIMAAHYSIRLSIYMGGIMLLGVFAFSICERLDITLKVVGTVIALIVIFWTIGNTVAAALPTRRYSKFEFEQDLLLGLCISGITALLSCGIISCYLDGYVNKHWNNVWQFLGVILKWAIVAMFAIAIVIGFITYVIPLL